MNELLKEIDAMCEAKWKDVEWSVQLGDILRSDIDGFNLLSNNKEEHAQMTAENSRTSQILACEYAGMREVYRKVKEFVEVAA